MYEHPPPDRKKEVKMTRFEASLMIETVKCIIHSLGIPPDIEDKINNALDSYLQSVIAKSKPK